MHPVSTDRRRRLLAASLRLERRLRREQTHNAPSANRRVAMLLRGGKPWDKTSV